MKIAILIFFCVMKCTTCEINYTAVDEQLANAFGFFGLGKGVIMLDKALSEQGYDLIYLQNLC